MATFTYAQLEGLALSVGVSADLAPTMAAIALAESGGCQYALAGPRDVRPVKQCTYRRTFGEQSYGLWQINIGVGTEPQLGLFDPHNNALAMAAKILNQGLDAWTTYTNGAYKDHLSPGTPAAPPPGSPGPVSVGPVPGQPAGQHAAGAWAELMHALQVDLGGSIFTSRRVRQRLHHRIR